MKAVNRATRGSRQPVPRAGGPTRHPLSVPSPNSFRDPSRLPAKHTGLRAKAHLANAAAAMNTEPIGSSSTSTGRSSVSDADPFPLWLRRPPCISDTHRTASGHGPLRSTALRTGRRSTESHGPVHVLATVPQSAPSFCEAGRTASQAELRGLGYRESARTVQPGARLAAT